MQDCDQYLRRKAKRVLFAGADNHSDLDSEAAKATDINFSEILRNKHQVLGKLTSSSLIHQTGA